MRANVSSLFCALLLLGCSSSPSSSGATRAVTGTLSAQSYTLDNPVVIAESSDQRVFVAHLSGGGRFTLNLPSNVAYRLTLANSTATAGVYSAVARINWPLADGAGRWAQLGAGDTLDLGTVYRRSSGPDGSRISSYGGSDGGDDSCHEADDSKCSHDHEDDCDCDHKYSEDDHCDKDGDAGQHDQDCDHEHGYGNVDGGCASCGGGGDDGDHGDHHGHGGGGYGGGYGGCDGGAPGGNGNGGGAGSGGGGGTGGTSANPGGAVGAPCNINSDCASGACIASACGTPSTQIP